MSCSRGPAPFPLPEELLPTIARERALVHEYISTRPGGLGIPNNFVITAPPFNPREAQGKGKGGGPGRGGGPAAPLFVNPQTEHLCALLGIPNLINTGR
jgi:hypothetical protein